MKEKENIKYSTISIDTSYTILGVFILFLFITGYWVLLLYFPWNCIFFVLVVSWLAGKSLLKMKNPVEKHLSYHLIALAIAIFLETAWTMTSYIIDPLFIENTLVLFSSGLILFYGISAFVYKKRLFMILAILYVLLLIFILQGGSIFGILSYLGVVIESES